MNRTKLRRYESKQDILEACGYVWNPTIDAWGHHAAPPIPLEKFLAHSRDSLIRALPEEAFAPKPQDAQETSQTSNGHIGII
jgi:hypothetical protein